MRRLAPIVVIASMFGGASALAFADDAGAPAPQAAPTTPAGQPPVGSQTPEGEPDEPDHPPKEPTPKQPAVVKQPTILRDGMLRIPGGRFTMGSTDKSAPSNERPARLVLVTPFWIDKTEVTVGAYRACVDRGACAKPAHNSSSCTYDLGDPQLPVSCVPWSSAQAYCVAAGKRLPREVEWEFAARGTQPLKYPWGGAASCGGAATLVREGNQRSCAGNHPSKVGAHAMGASPFGVLDMSGNVEEWVNDWYSESLGEASPRAGASHVLRGGGWLSAPQMARTTSRNWGSVQESGPNVGFRCAKDD